MLQVLPARTSRIQFNLCFSAIAFWQLKTELRTSNELILALKVFLVEAMKQGNDAFLDCANVIIKDRHFKYLPSSNITRLLLADLFAKE